MGVLGKGLLKLIGQKIGLVFDECCIYTCFTGILRAYSSMKACFASTAHIEIMPLSSLIRWIIYPLAYVLRSIYSPLDESCFLVLSTCVLCLKSSLIGSYRVILVISVILAMQVYWV